jgi:hypothetical protein
MRVESPMNIEHPYRRLRPAWRPYLAAWQWFLILGVALLMAGLLVLDIHARLTQGAPTVGTGFVVTHDMPAGYALQSGDYKAMPLTYATSTIAYLTTAPSGRVTAVPLHANTLLADTELLPAGVTMDDVAIHLTDPPPIAAGQQIDLLLNYGNSQIRIGEHIPVDGVDPVTIRVPHDDAPYWISLVQSKLPMYAVVTTDTTDTKPITVDLCAALKKLGGVVNCTASAVQGQTP